MATYGDFRVADGHRWGARPYQTKAGQTAITAGKLVIQDTSGDEEYVQLPADGAGSSQVWVGLAVSNDTVTSSTDGVVYVVDAVEAEFVGKPTTPANLATALKLTTVTLDVASDGLQTVDENDTTNPALIIRDYNTARKEITVKIDRSTHFGA
jgi:hypothetical protein